MCPACKLQSEQNVKQASRRYAKTDKVKNKQKIYRAINEDNIKQKTLQKK
jgi:hypothetical protein